MKRGEAAGHIGFAAASGVLVWSAFRARSREVSPREELVFRTFNNASDAMSGKVWTVMQYGSFGAVPVVAAVIAVRRGVRDGGVVGIAGTSAWLCGKVLKVVVGRGRPADHLRSVQVRGKPQSGLGYPSGHASVSLTLAITSTVTFPSRTAAIVASWIASGGRVYVGAHLPLDVAGGLALGAIVGGVANRLRDRIELL
ncbi:MAG: phosphatase PAP2 family protein [Acidimicrobiales bacterium]